MRMVLKMVAVVPLLLLLCFPSTDSLKDCTLYAAKGQDIIVPLSTALAETDSLRWKKNDVLIFYQRQSVVRTGKQTDITADGSLRLKNVNDGSKGIYTTEIHDANGARKDTTKPIHLCVIDPPPKPTLSFKCLADSVKFTCGVQTKGLTIQWLQKGVVLPKQGGTSLTLKEHHEIKDPFNCRVSNQASAELSKPVTHNCEKPSIFPETVLGFNTWILVGIGGGVVVVLIVIVIVCCICAKRKRRMHLKEEGELRLAWTNEEQHQYQDHSQDHHHSHQHQHRQQQPAGHTGPRQHRSKSHQNLHPQQQPAGHTNPRQHRSKSHQDLPPPRAANNPNAAQPQPSPRRPAQAPPPPGTVDEEQPPPLPQPRKKGGKAARV